ncbi:MAG: hypothetical protein KDK91_23500 [Gammaproteobacteria bacterium]|nr:hypothetical protein [Gammaproteobacteria bacterium]
MSRTLKFLHVLGAIGLTGSLVCCLTLVHVADEDATLQTLLRTRQDIDAICTWVLLPSLMIVLFAGLLAIAAHAPFMQARWVWVKAATGLAMFEGTLGLIQGPAREAVKLTASALDGRLQPDRLELLVPDQRTSLCVMLSLAIANIALAIWRPRLGQSRQTGGGATT